MHIVPYMNQALKDLNESAVQLEFLLWYSLMNIYIIEP